MLSIDSSRRVLSGMRPSGRLHLGQYHGVLKNWVKLQKEYECFFLLADWRGLTTHYAYPQRLMEHCLDIVVDWLAVGINPGASPIFLESQVPQHAELHLLLSMITPVSWLERIPSYREYSKRAEDPELDTYGYLGAPLLQSADVLLYRAGYVAVGHDQVPQIEVTRSVARRFNYLYGREAGFEESLELARRKMGKKVSELYGKLRTQYREQGDAQALETAKALIRDQQSITMNDQERLLGGLDGTGRCILPEPQALVGVESSLLGVDGQKMSNSANNTIELGDDPDQVWKKLKTMRTDPARERRSDPGNPDVCPVWSFHKLYSDESQQAWVRDGCTSAGIGCIDCKKKVAEGINADLQPLQIRRKEYQNDIAYVQQVLNDGAEKAEEEAEVTLDDVRQAMGLARTF